MKYLLILIAIIITVILLSTDITVKRQNSPSSTIDEKITASPTPYQFPYVVPKLPKQRSYRIVIVGDSIVASLGLNANTLREKLIDYYPQSEFVTYNYGYGSTNIESLPERLSNKTQYQDQTNQAILQQGFEIIIIESFGYNPLSHYSLSAGLETQEEIVTNSVREIIKSKPDSVILFMTPIALSEKSFAQGTVDLNQEQRENWVTERIEYINNHKAIAEKLNIPLIDVYKASLNDKGEVETRYVSDDNIHPSNEGIDLISQTIADYIFTHSIIPR